MPITLPLQNNDFVLGDDDLAELSIRPAGGRSSLFYFYHQRRRTLIKRFVVGRSSRRDRIAAVTLVKGSNGKFSPRFEFSIRDTGSRAIEKSRLPIETGEDRQVTARVALEDDHANFNELLAFLAQLPSVELASAEYRVVPESDAKLLDQLGGEVLEAIRSGSIPAEEVGGTLLPILEAPGIAEAIARAGVGPLLRTAVQSAELTDALAKLRNAVEASDVPEQVFQDLLTEHWWIFGGQFIDLESRRKLTVLDQLDLPLIQADGSLHIVELKRADIPQLVKPYRNHFIVGPQVNEVAGQAANYLRELDTQAANIRQSLGVDVVRAEVTAVVGSALHCDIDDEEIYKALRTYNGHLSRIKIITYDQLLAGGERMAQIAKGSLDMTT